MRFIRGACGRAEEIGRVGGMQGSSNAVSPVLYRTAVTVRFFDAAVLALFASGLKEWLLQCGDSLNRPRIMVLAP